MKDESLAIMYEGALEDCVSHWNADREPARPAKLTSLTVCDFQAKRMIYEQGICFLRNTQRLSPGLLSIWFILFCVTLDYAFHFPKKGVEDVVKISQMRSLTAFTVCLWMSSSNNKGTLVSYAVSNSENELLIDYDRHFEVQIGGTPR